MEVSKADFARMAGVSKAAISKKSKNKRLIVNSAGLLDTDNPINRMYLEKHQKELNKCLASFPAFQLVHLLHQLNQQRLPLCCLCRQRPAPPFRGNQQKQQQQHQHAEHTKTAQAQN